MNFAFGDGSGNDENGGAKGNNAKRKKYTTSIENAKSFVDKIKKVDDLEQLKEYVDGVIDEKREQEEATVKVAALMKNPQLVEILNTLERSCAVCKRALWWRPQNSMWSGVVVHRCCGNRPMMVHATCESELTIGVSTCPLCVANGNA